MTSVYGVTLQGASAQVLDAIETINDSFYLIDKQEFHTHRHGLSTYLAQTIQKSISGLFPVASAIQDWLGMCVSLVTRSSKDVMDGTGTTMMWDTPLGFPVVQDYQVPSHKRVSTFLFLQTPFLHAHLGLDFPDIIGFRPYQHRG